MEEYELARSNLDEAIRLDPTYVSTYGWRGLAHQILGNSTEAERDLQKAKELVFLAEDVPAEEAQRLGLCNRVVPGADLRDAATEWAERLASGPTRSFMLSKWLLNRSLDVDRRTLEDNEAWAVELISGTEDAAEGVASFLERRDPSWRGF